MKKVIERRWLRVDGGISEIEVPVPADNNRIEVTFAGTHDFDRKMACVTVIPMCRPKI